MAMDTYIKDQGAWRQAMEIYAKEQGEWKPCSEGWVKRQGQWEQFFGKSGEDGGPPDFKFLGEWTSSSASQSHSGTIDIAPREPGSALMLFATAYGSNANDDHMGYMAEFKFAGQAIPMQHFTPEANIVVAEGVSSYPNVAMLDDGGANTGSIALTAHMGHRSNRLWLKVTAVEIPASYGAAFIGGLQYMPGSLGRAGVTAFNFSYWGIPSAFMRQDDMIVGSVTDINSQSTPPEFSVEDLETVVERQTTSGSSLWEGLSVGERADREGRWPNRIGYNFSAGGATLTLGSGMLAAWIPRKKDLGTFPFIRRLASGTHVDTGQTSSLTVPVPDDGIARTPGSFLVAVVAACRASSTTVTHNTLSLDGNAMRKEAQMAHNGGSTNSSGRSSSVWVLENDTLTGAYSAAVSISANSCIQMTVFEVFGYETTAADTGSANQQGNTEAFPELPNYDVDAVAGDAMFIGWAAGPALLLSSFLPREELADSAQSQHCFFNGGALRDNSNATNPMVITTASILQGNGGNGNTARSISGIGSAAAFQNNAAASFGYARFALLSQFRVEYFPNPITPTYATPPIPGDYIQELLGDRYDELLEDALLNNPGLRPE